VYNLYYNDQKQVLLCNAKLADAHTHTHAAFMCLFFEVATGEQKPQFIHSRSAGNTKHTLYIHTSAGLLDMSKVLS